MTRRRFYNLLAGLSAQSVFRAVAGEEIAVVDDPGQIRNALHS